MRNRIIAKASMILMGIFVYLILSITMYQNAMAAPVGAGGNSHQLGEWYDMHRDDKDYFAAVMTVAVGITTAVNAKAIGDCTVDGDVEYSCVQTRRNMIMGYVNRFNQAIAGGTSNAHGADAFWKWVLESEVDEEVAIGFALAIYVHQLVGSFEEES